MGSLMTLKCPAIFSGRKRPVQIDDRNPEHRPSKGKTMLRRHTLYRLFLVFGFLGVMPVLLLPLKGLSAPALLAKETAMPAVTATPTPTPTPSQQRIPIHGNIYTYVSVMDPNIVEDVFGKRISDRFVAIQVTLANKNSQFQFLIHDVSLDLKDVFGKRLSYNLAMEAWDRSDCVIDRK